MMSAAEDDVLKATFKRLKQKNCSLEEVVDMGCERCCAEVLERVPIVAEPATDHMSDTWSCYTHSLYRGLYVMRGAFSEPGRQKLLLDALVTYLAEKQTSEDHIAQLRSNLSCLDVNCHEGSSYWSSLDENGNPLVNKLRWISMGYHYDWTAREYRLGFRSEFPPELIRIAREAARRVGDDLLADAVIVNYYHPGDTLSFHQDELEWDLTKPLISISLGLPGILCVGGTDRHTAPISILLKHGDIVVMSGAARTAYHAVPRVFDSYSVRACQHQPVLEESAGKGNKRKRKGKDSQEMESENSEFVSDMLRGLDAGQLDECIAPYDRNIGTGVFSKVVREFLQRTRINVSIRQVEKH